MYGSGLLHDVNFREKLHMYGSGLLQDVNFREKLQLKMLSFAKSYISSQNMDYHQMSIFAKSHITEMSIFAKSYI